MKKKYIIVFDTNILFNDYKSSGNFCKFSFSSPFEKICRRIEELEIYDYVGIAIPVVTWEEIKKHVIDSYSNKFKEVKAKLDKHNFPNIKVEIETLDYNLYITQQIEEYKKNITSNKNFVKTITLELPSDLKFTKIVKRAFAKSPPFIGKEKESDKGFKDAVLWESIIEFKEKNEDVKLILFCQDNLFNSELQEEYAKQFNEEIKFFKQKSDLIEYLDMLAKQLNEFSVIPTSKDDENEIEILIKSEKFLNKVRCSEYLTSLSNELHLENISLIDIENYNKIEDKSEIDYEQYEVCIKLNLDYSNKQNKTQKISFKKSFIVTLSVITRYDYYIDGIEEFFEEELKDENG